MNSRRALLALHLAAALLMASGALTRSWWVRGLPPLAEGRIGLVSARACVLGQCTDLPSAPGRHSGPTSTLFTATFAVLLGAALLFALAGAIGLWRDEPMWPGRVASAAALALAMSFIAGLRGGLSEASYSFYLALAGGLIGFIAGLGGFAGPRDDVQALIPLRRPPGARGGPTERGSPDRPPPP